MRRSIPLIALLLFAGCGAPPKAVLVSGKLLRDGKALTGATKGLPPGDPGVRLGFSPMSADAKAGERYYAQLSTTDGTFVLKGPMSKGVPPGKYRVTVEMGAMGRPDELKGDFGPEKSPLVVELPDSITVNVVVDIGKKTVRLE